MQKLSVIVPLYNCADKIGRLIESLKAQSYKNIEILIVNDGSTDGSETVCRRLVAGDSRFIIIDQKNLGVSAARNAGLRVAKGEFISFADADDWVENDMYQILIHRLEGNDSQLAVCGIMSHLQGRTSGTSSPLGNSCYDLAGLHGVDHPNTLIQAMIDNTPHSIGLAHPVNKIYLSSIIRDNNLQFDCNINFAEDWLFNISYLRFCKRVSFEYDTLYNYDCTDGASLSKRYRKDAFNTSVYIRQQLAYWFPSSCSGINYYKKIFNIEHHFICQHGRFWGFKDFGSTVKSIFFNTELKKAYAMYPKLGNPLLRIGAKTGYFHIYLIVCILVAGGVF